MDEATSITSEDSNPLATLVVQQVASSHQQSTSNAVPPVADKGTTLNEAKAEQGSRSTTVCIAIYLDPHLRLTPDSL